MTHPGSAFGPPRRVDRPIVSEVSDRLFVGAYLTPEDIPWLSVEHRVTAILCLQDDADFAARGLDARALAEAGSAAGVRWRRIQVPDFDVEALGLRLGTIVDDLADLLGRGERVYLHCSAGFNRAPTAAIAYLHARCGLDLDAATALVEARRSCEPYARALEIFAAARAG